MNGTGVEITVDRSSSDKEMGDKEHQLERILSENLRMLPDKSDEVDKFGPYLEVYPEDDDLLHAQEHRAFIATNTLRPQYKSRLETHAKKHDIAYAEKKRMGLIEENNNSNSEENNNNEEY